MVTKFVPLPDNSGGRMRSLATARRLAGVSDLTLVAFNDGTCDPDGMRRLGIDVRPVTWSPDLSAVAAGVLRSGSISAGRFAVPALRSAVRQAAADVRPDVLVIGYQQLAGLGQGVQARRRVLDLHNVESDLVARWARTRRQPLRAAVRLEAAALRRLERRQLPRFDLVTVVSAVDAARLPVAPTEVRVCPNGLDPSAPLPPASEPVACFVATMGWAPNDDAARWLGQDIWPRVRQRLPAARLLLVGRDPSPAVRALAGTGGIEVTGTVEDVRPYLAQARVALAPLRAGGGTRLKILEALDAGRPTVATTIGAEGLTHLAGDGLVVADGALDQATAIADLLADGARAEELGQRGRAAVHHQYSWDRTLAPLIEWVRAGAG